MHMKTRSPDVTLAKLDDRNQLAKGWGNFRNL